jgi:hypothetical protein
MPNQTTLPVQAGQLPIGFCPTDTNALLAAFASAMSVALPDMGASFGVQSQLSTPSDTSKPWLRLDSLGRPVRLYTFAQGAWLSPHPIPSGLTMWWFTALPDFTLFDGGDSNTISAVSGPMWQQALDASGNLISAKFPIAAGTLPSGTVLVPSATGGEEKHILTAAEGVDPSHQHIVGRFDSTSGNTAAWLLTTPSTSSTVDGAAQRCGGGDNVHTNNLSQLTGLTSNPDYAITSGVNNPAAVVGHATMPPWVCGYLLQRTIRQFFSESQ